MRPRRTICRPCGAPIMEAPLETGETIALERHEAAGVNGGYTVWDDGVARPVSARRQVMAHRPHDCPKAES